MSIENNSTEMMMTNETNTAGRYAGRLAAKRAAVQAKIKALRFGTEIEYTGISRAVAAQAVLSVVGGTCAYVGGSYSKHVVTAPDGRKWTIMHDGSVTGSAYDRGGEFVTPILAWDDMDLLQNVVRALCTAGAKVNNSCGQHVHVDGAEFKADTEKLRDLVAFGYRWEAPVMASAAILPSRLNYCDRVRSSVYDRFIASRVRNIGQAQAAWYGHSHGGSDHYDHSRYCWLNVHALFDKGTIEFRMWNATLHAGKVRAHIVASLAMIANVLLSRSVSFRGRAESVQTSRKLVSARTIVELLHFNLFLSGEEFKNVRNHLTAAALGRAEVA